jgi:ABC-type transporter Mla subunit MlaD
LLGDRFVNVTMPPGQPKKFLGPNSYISGAREGGLDDITREGSALINDLRGTVQKIDTTVDRLNKEALSPTNMQNFKASMEHLSSATDALSQSSQKLDGVIEKADGAMASIKKDAEDLQNTIADARKVFQSATQGKGLLPTLLTNQELANDLRALIANLRAHGVLFYRDSAAKIDMNAREQTKPARPTGGR